MNKTQRYYKLGKLAITRGLVNPGDKFYGEEVMQKDNEKETVEQKPIVRKPKSTITWEDMVKADEPWKASVEKAKAEIPPEKFMEWFDANLSYFSYCYLCKVRVPRQTWGDHVMTETHKDKLTADKIDHPEKYDQTAFKKQQEVSLMAKKKAIEKTPEPIIEEKVEAEVIVEQLVVEDPVVEPVEDPTEKPKTASPKTNLPRIDKVAAATLDKTGNVGSTSTKLHFAKNLVQKEEEENEENEDITDPKDALVAKSPPEIPVGKLPTNKDIDGYGEPIPVSVEIREKKPSIATRAYALLGDPAMGEKTYEELAQIIRDEYNSKTSSASMGWYVSNAGDHTIIPRRRDPNKNTATARTRTQPFFLMVKAKSSKGTGVVSSLVFLGEYAINAVEEDTDFARLVDGIRESELIISSKVLRLSGKQLVDDESDKSYEALIPIYFPAPSKL